MHDLTDVGQMTVGVVKQYVKRQTLHILHKLLLFLVDFGLRDEKAFVVLKELSTFLSLYFLALLPADLVREDLTLVVETGHALA